MKPNDLGIARDHRALEALFAKLEAGSGADDTTREVIVKADGTQRTALWPRSTGSVVQFVEALVVFVTALYFPRRSNRDPGRLGGRLVGGRCSSVARQRRAAHRKLISPERPHDWLNELIARFPL